MKLLSNRISFKDHSAEKFTTIIISPKIEKWKESLLFGWLILWTILGCFMVYAIFTGYGINNINANYSLKESKLYLVLFMLFWMYFEFKIGKVFLWRKKGTEYLKLSKHSLGIKKSIGVYGKVKEYLLPNVIDLELSIPKEKSFNQVMSGTFWDIGNETIFFSYLNKQIGIGRQLSEEEAEKLLKLLKSRIKLYKN